MMTVETWQFDVAEKSTEPAHGDAFNACSHVANAHRFAHHFGDCALYVEGIGWHRWNPPWRHDELGVRALAQGLGRIIANEAAGLAQWVADAPNSDERDRRKAAMTARFRWAGQSEQSAVIDASLKQAQPLMRCRADELDANPLLLGLPRGVLELQAGVHREHRQSDRITKVAGSDFDPVARAPKFERFLAYAMNGDADRIDYLQRLFGYCLSGNRGEHIFMLWVGSGANGKSVLVGVMQDMWGDYSGTAAPGLLMRQSGNEHPTGLADLQGKRIVIASETGERGRLNEEQVKLLTGGDRISARRMRMDFYQFDPTHQFIVLSNHKPRVSGTDEGIWRRIRLVPFDVVVPPEHRDPLLREKLRAELPGILRWALEGWQKYKQNGFNTPAAVTDASNNYRTASDMLGEFIASTCDIDQRHTVTAADLYRAYGAWCTDAGEHPRSQRDFGMSLGERGFDQVRSGKARRWRGLRLQNDMSDASDPAFRFNATREQISSIQSERPVTSVTCVTAAEYVRVRDGEPDP